MGNKKADAKNDGPDLEDLKTRCCNPIAEGGKLDPKHRKTAITVPWDDLSQIAFLYWRKVHPPHAVATPKEVESEYREVAEALDSLISKMRLMSYKSMEWASVFGSKMLNKKGISLAEAMKGKMIAETPLEHAWIDCDGAEWFLSHAPYAMRTAGRTGVAENVSLDEWHRLCDGPKIQELSRVAQLARHFEATAATVKVHRANAGFGGSWGDSVWDEDPTGTLCRAVRYLLAEAGLHVTHAIPIAWAIEVWAHPEWTDDEQVRSDSWGKRRIK